MRAVALEIQLDQTLFIQNRFAELIDGNKKRLSGAAIEKFNDDMKEADAGAVSFDNGFRNLALVLQAVQAALRFLQLFAQFRIGLLTGDRHLLFQGFGLGKQRFAGGGVVFSLRIDGAAFFFGATEKVALLHDAAAEARDFCFQLDGVFAAAAVGERSNERGDYGDHRKCDERRENPHTLARDRATAKSFDSQLRQMFLVFGLLQLAAQFGFGPAIAKLTSHASREFERIEGRGDDVVGTEIESASAFECATLYHHECADGLGLLAGFDLGNNAATAQVRGGASAIRISGAIDSICAMSTVVSEDTS